LMLLIDARRPARTDAIGELITLAAQDRTLWDQALIAEGIALISRAIGSGAVGEYQIQAAIAAIHDRARRAGDTDWRRILALCGLPGANDAQSDRQPEQSRCSCHGRRRGGGLGDARRGRQTPQW